MGAHGITLDINPSELIKSVDTLSILVVDDDTTCLTVIATMLKKFQYEVATVKHPNDALCTLRIKGSAFDLVVSDVHMPDMNGFELQRAITEEFNLPVVLMSGDGEKSLISRGLESGAAFFISKPVSADKLKVLRKFANMKKESQNIIKEDDDDKSDSDTEGILTSPSTNDGMINKTELKRKSPRSEKSDENIGESSNFMPKQKKQKLVWTSSLHNRFLEALVILGTHKAVPKKILEFMKVPGLTRENIASHLQKYRIFLKKAIKIITTDAQNSSVDPEALARKAFIASLTSSPSPSLETSSPIHMKYLNRSNGFINQTYLNQSSFVSQQSGNGRSRLFSGSTSTLKPNTGSITQIDLGHVGLVQNNYHHVNGSVQGNIFNIPLEYSASIALPSTFDVSMSGPTQETCMDGLNMLDVRRFIAKNKPSDVTTNFHNTYGGTVAMPSDGMTNLDEYACQFGDSSTSSLNYFMSNINTGGCPLSDVIAEYQPLLPDQNVALMGNAVKTHETPYTPLVDFATIDCQFATQQSGCESVINSGFYGSATSHWDNHVPPLDQVTSLQRSDDDFLESLLSPCPFPDQDRTMYEER